MAVREFNFDAFLSHSADDREVVRNLAERLRSDGLRIWFHEWAIPPGASIPIEVDIGLEQSRNLILFMSVSSFGSEWVSLESQTFRFADPANRELRLIPVRLDDTEPPRASLRQFAYIDWRGGGSEDAYARLLGACRHSSDLTFQYGSEDGQKSADGLGVFRISQDHSSKVSAVTISPDGTLAIFGFLNGLLQIVPLIGDSRPHTLPGHPASIKALAVAAKSNWLISAAEDRTLRIWDIRSGIQINLLGGHSSTDFLVAVSADGKRVVYTSGDWMIWTWDLEGRVNHRILGRHSGRIRAMSVSEDGRFAVTGSDDGTVRVWDIESGASPQIIDLRGVRISSIVFQDECVCAGCDDGAVRIWSFNSMGRPRLLGGQSSPILDVSLSDDCNRVLSASTDGALRIWDLSGQRPSRVIEDLSSRINAVSLSPNRRQALWASEDGTVRVWDFKNELRPGASEDLIRYTNAKVIVVGDKGSGKTGITVRLAHDLPPSHWPSTSGVWATQWVLKDLFADSGWDRELWLWDFGGQADQRLIHQLYLDGTAVVLLVFDADNELVLPGLREWQQAIRRSVPLSVPVILAAGRTDVGSRFDRARVKAFAEKNGYAFLETSAENNRGIPELRKILLNVIPWRILDHQESPARYKRLKDEIVQIRDEGELTLLTFKELESILSARLPATFDFSSRILQNVISLLDSPGIVKDLKFGSYILLRPEWINIYAQAVIRTLRAEESGLGYMPVRAIREGCLIFQSDRIDEQSRDVKRLRIEDERIVLQSMEAALLERRLCLQHEGNLVFPGHCGRERPHGAIPGKKFVGYTITGFLNDIYATLVVKLAHCGTYRLKELYKGAADFHTKQDDKFIGIRLLNDDDGSGQILTYVASDVTEEERVVFAAYIQDHLDDTSTSEVERIRYYVCSKCKEAVENRVLAMERVRLLRENAQILCPRCEGPVLLWDKVEALFVDQLIRNKVRGLHIDESSDRNARQAGIDLFHEVFARLLSAGQDRIKIERNQGSHFDLGVEFSDEHGRGIGRGMYLVLREESSDLVKAELDGSVTFEVPEQEWVRNCIEWSAQGPVRLVIGTVSSFNTQGSEAGVPSARVRWMEIGELLSVVAKHTTVSRIKFVGEQMDAESVLRLRDGAKK